MKKRGKPSTLPEVAFLTLERPPVMEGCSDEEVRTKILRLVDEKELEYLAKWRKEGREVMGPRRCRQLSCWSTPKTSRTLFTTNPRVSGSSAAGRIRVLEEDRAFIDAYREARERFMAGERDVQWPYGTWLMVRVHRMPVRERPSVGR